ncbi:MAG: AmmeMemoRadiSam system protein A [Coriobacteriales bacterium]|nr:AmmeMemoRadiSam system protein A [Coriobacteriales bacterium]
MSVLATCAVPHPPLIIPSVGRGKQDGIQATIDAYNEVARRIAALAPDTILVVSPHATIYADYFHISPGESAKGSMASFGAPFTRMELDYDKDFVRELAVEARHEGIAGGTYGEREPKLDHGTFIPLYFIRQYYTDFKLVRMGFSGMPALDHYRMGQCIARVAERLGRRVVLVASGDLSHKLKEDGPYGFVEQGPQFDEQIGRIFAQADFLQLLDMDPAFCDRAAECGLRSFQIMAGALDGRAVTSELLSYEGPFGVGYGVAWFQPGDVDKDRCFAPQLERLQQERMEARRAAEDPYVRLARYSLECFVGEGRRCDHLEALDAVLTADEVAAGVRDELLERAAGCFCSIKKDGQLRGCIGTISAVTPCLAQEICRNAISACSQDPRFDAVEPQELPSLVYDVDVLGSAEAIDGPEQLDVKRYGVIVTRGLKRGLLLPDLDGVDTVEDQIAIAKRKAGISADADVKLQRFEVVRHL